MFKAVVGKWARRHRGRLRDIHRIDARIGKRRLARKQGTAPVQRSARFHQRRIRTLGAAIVIAPAMKWNQQLAVKESRQEALIE